MANVRKFSHTTASRSVLPLLVAFYGPSGSGKTKSALRAATGIQRIKGGKIFVIDTESGRSLQYAPKRGEKADPPNTFDFEHVSMADSFGPLDYLDAINYCVANGASVIVVDSASHEHEGPGGVLDQHTAAHAKLGGGDNTKMLAWSAPKQARQRLINTVVQLPGTVATIWCFRAKEKVDMDAIDPKNGKKTIAKLGWMPIGGDAFLYEMTVRVLFEPGADGVPTWAPMMPGEKEMVRVPAQFRSLLNEQTKHAFCEADGEAMARWMNGDMPARTVVCFRANVTWEIGAQWAKKPLAEAPLDALLLYREALRGALLKTDKPAARDVISNDLEHVDAEIGRKEPQPDSAAADAAQ